MPLDVKICGLKQPEHVAAALEGGRLCALGTHDELSRQPGYYRDAILAEKGDERGDA